MSKNVGGRPSVLILVVKSGKNLWTKSRKAVSVDSMSLSADGGEAVVDGVRYRAAALPGYPGDGSWRFTEHRGVSIPAVTDELDEDGLNREEAAMLQEIIKHGITFADAMVEFLWLHRRDPKKAHRFHRLLQADGWNPPDRESLAHIKEQRRKFETEDWRTPEELAAWEIKHAEDLREIEKLPRFWEPGFVREEEPFEI